MWKQGLPQSKYQLFFSKRSVSFYNIGRWEATVYIFPEFGRQLGVNFIVDYNFSLNIYSIIVY